jgi:hypothetical protein
MLFVFLLFAVAVGNKIKDWPTSFAVKFGVTIQSFNAIELPSELFYDWANKQQVVRHYSCPVPFLKLTQCKVVFQADKGTHIVEELGLLPVCCKAFDLGPVFPALFSQYAVLNASNLPCDSFLGDGRLCESYDLYGHATYLVDSETQDPISFTAIFPPPAGVVSWTFYEKFRLLDSNEMNSDGLFSVPGICLPTCPFSQGIGGQN